MKKKSFIYTCSIVLSLSVAAFAICFPTTFESVSDLLFGLITEDFSWYFQLVMFGFVVYVLVLAFSRYGNIKLGKDNAKPEYSLFTWFAMLFCAGMGVGLVFWGVSEPISHFINPVDGIDSMSSQAAEFAIKSSFMHWGLHPWAGYAVVGLALAYFQYRKGANGLISSSLDSMLGDKYVVIRNIIDIFASLACVAGIVTSLGLGALQVNSGLNKVFGMPVSLFVQVTTIVCVTAIFLVSSISGIDKGINILSKTNVSIAIVLMMITFFIEPKTDVLSNCVNGIGQYLNDFIKDSLNISPYGDSSQWIKTWRVFYWAWWIAWAPFVGMFIARISKGRTIREFILGVVGAPTLASIIWFAIFGTFGINAGLDGLLTKEKLMDIAAHPEIGVFEVFSGYPMGKAISVVVIILVIVFFITSADSGTFVLAMMSSEGNMNPPKRKKIVWGLTQSGLAIGLLISGGLKPLQTISIVGALPFALVMVGQCISLVKALKSETLGD